MSYKTILAVLQGQEEAGRVLDCALPLATRFSAHLVGVHAEAIPVPYVTPMGFPDTDFLAASAEINQQRTEEIKALFAERTRREGVANTWQALESVSGDSAVGALAAARVSDLVIAQQADPDAGSGTYANVEALIFESGRPVLFVPYATPVDTAFRKVLVAWNGSQQAARAVFDALPFLTAADAVTILTLDATDTAQHDAAVSGADLAEALARHGARVTLSSQATGGIGAGEAIENEISDGGHTLLVMGAYSQSWLKQFFFGGTTRTVLQSMPVATLMSR